MLLTIFLWLALLLNVFSILVHWRTWLRHRRLREGRLSMPPWPLRSDGGLGSATGANRDAPGVIAQLEEMELVREIRRQNLRTGPGGLSDSSGRVRRYGPMPGSSSGARGSEGLTGDSQRPLPSSNPVPGVTLAEGTSVDSDRAVLDTSTGAGRRESR